MSKSRSKKSKNSQNQILSKNQCTDSAISQSQIQRQQSTTNKQSAATAPQQKPLSKPLQQRQSLIKLQFRDLKFIEQIFQKQHGSVYSRQQVQQYRKKTLKTNLVQSNPYRQLNYNLDTLSQWKDNMKKNLTAEEIVKYKIHFLGIMKMIQKGMHGRYTLRDLAKEFNLDQSAFLVLKRQFSIDPDVSIFLNKSMNEPQINSVISSPKLQNIVLKIVSKNPFLTCNQIRSKLKMITKGNSLDITVDMIQNSLEKDGYLMKDVVKYPKSRNQSTNLTRKKLFCEKINEILIQTDYKVYFFGLSIYHSFMFRKKVWTQNEHYSIQPSIDQCFYLLAIAEKSGKGTWKIQKQLHKQEVFLETVRKLFQLILQDNSEPKFIVVDISLYKKYGQLLKKARSKGDIRIIWMPPFSYNLNPLEYWFSEIKGSLLKSKKTLALSEQYDNPQKNFVLIQDIYKEVNQVFQKKFNFNFNFIKYFQKAAEIHEKALSLEEV